VAATDTPTPDAVSAPLSEVEARADARLAQLAVMESAMTERLAELELALEDRGWVQLGMGGEAEFSRGGLNTIAKISRLMYRKNPLINRGVEVQRLYVFGQGVSVACGDERANEVIQEFLDDHGNQEAFTGQQALGDAEKELRCTGNVFLCIFKPAVASDVLRVRPIQFEEIEEIICNPGDRSEPWYYKRVWQRQEMDPQTGRITWKQDITYYPDWRYDPKGEERLESIGGKPVEWDSPIMHVKTGGFFFDQFGTSEVYAALDWARAHKEHLEDWASITRSLRKFAWKAKVAGGAAEVAAAKAAYGTTVSRTAGETNPPPLAGSMQIENAGMDLQPIKTAGATTGPSDSRFLLLQVAAAVGLPETFFGDASIGNYATSKTLDRPTEMQFAERQRLWRKVILSLCLTACRERGVEPEEEISVVFPPILEHDIEAAINAIVKGVTLDGKPPLVIPDLAELARLVLATLGIDDVDEKVAAMFPDGARADQQVPEQEAALVEALAELRGTLQKAAEHV